MNHEILGGAMFKTRYSMFMYVPSEKRTVLSSKEVEHGPLHQGGKICGRVSNVQNYLLHEP